ncbi:hypothetical protein AAEX28_04765 [Lentisphaerota bacterium WC36G]|nr:hypothetical protein LJT99_07625 [Lentisphaerae bacterium WC36]
MEEERIKASEFEELNKLAYMLSKGNYKSEVSINFVTFSNPPKPKNTFIKNWFLPKIKPQLS